MRTCRAGGTGGPHAELAVCFFSCKREGGCCWYRPLLLLPPEVKVQEEVQPLPSFLRSEHTEAGAAALPLCSRLRLVPGRAHPAAAAARPLQSSRPPPPARLRDPARAAAPVRAPPPLPSPFVSSTPAPPPRLALCRGRSARPQRAREKPRRARLRGKPLLLLLLPARARPSWLRAGAAWRAGGEVVGAFSGGAHLFARVPPGGRSRRGGGRAEKGEEKSGRSSRSGGSYVGGGALCCLDSPIRAGGVCAWRTCETTEPQAGTCG